MSYQPDYAPVPPAGFSVLTRFYDVLCSIFGFGGGLKRKALAIAAIRDGETVLDIGCGTGVFLKMAAKRISSARFIGVDPDADALRIAEKRLRKYESIVVLKKGFAEELPIESGSVDVCVSSLAFHHMPDAAKKKAVAEIFRVLRPGGRVLIADFGKAESTSRFIVSILTVIENTEYLKGNFEGLIPQLLTEAGFRDVAIVIKRFPGIHFVAGRKT